MEGDINLNQLKAFYYAASCGSITRAAEKLYITQPAVSMQIKALEVRFGIRLFIRKKKKLQLTELGSRLFRVAERIFELVGEAEEVLTKTKSPTTEVLKIGSTKTLVRYLLAPFISGFQKSFPKVQIQIDEGSSQTMVQAILEDRNHLAIVGRVNYDEKIEVVPYIQDELVLLVAPGHPLCSKEPVSLHDLRDEHLILRERGSGTREVGEDVFESFGLYSSAFVQTSNVDLIKELVSISNGVTMLARMGVDEDVSKGRLKMLESKEGPFILDIDIVFNKARKLSSIDKAFIEMLKSGVRKGQMAYEIPVHASDHMGAAEVPAT